MIDDRSAPIWVSRYTLRPRGFLNALSRRSVLEGALIRTGGGHACIHPWPELGDPPLDKCLADLAGTRRWPIVKRALRLAQYDAVAREHEDSLFEEMEVPASHATLTEPSAAAIAAAVAAGFTTVKLKLGRDPAKAVTLLDAFATDFPTLTWRLDFNEVPTPEEIRGFLISLRPETLRSIGFLEDPCPYSPATWRELFRAHRVPLAVDREASPRSDAAQVLVVKPAIDEPWLLAEAAIGHGQPVVVTSYMDHPVGQAFAAWEAARLGLQFPGLVTTCGLQTHHLFEPTAFSEMLGTWSPAFTPPGGCGIGFDDLLDALPWTRL